MDEQEQQDPSDDGYLEAQRSIIRQSFDEIVTDIGTEMRRAHLRFPLGITIPSSGSAFVTMVTPADDGDVPEAAWEQASEIVQHVVSKKLGGLRLRSKRLPCAMVNLIMNATDMAPNALDFGTRL